MRSSDSIPTKSPPNKMNPVIINTIASATVSQSFKWAVFSFDVMFAPRFDNRDRGAPRHYEIGEQRLGIGRMRKNALIGDSDGGAFALFAFVGLGNDGARQILKETCLFVRLAGGCDRLAGIASLARLGIEWDFGQQRYS